MISQVLKLLVELCQGRNTPAALPAGTAMMNSLLIAYLLTSLFALVMFRNITVAMPVAVGATTLTAILTYGVLALRGRGARAPQTVSAVAGTGAIINVVTLPAYLLVLGSGSFGLAGLVNLATIGWSMFVVAHIFRAALDEPLGTAMLYSLGYHVVLLVGLAMFEPATAPAPVAMALLTAHTASLA